MKLRLTDLRVGMRIDSTRYPLRPLTITHISRNYAIAVAPNGHPIGLDTYDLRFCSIPKDHK